MLLDTRLIVRHGDASRVALHGQSRQRTRWRQQAVRHPAKLTKFFGMSQFDPVITDGEQALVLQLMNDLVDLNSAASQRTGEDSLTDREAEAPFVASSGAHRTNVQFTQ